MTLHPGRRSWKLLLALPILLGAAPEIPDPTPEQIEQCVLGNRPLQTSEQLVTFRARDRIGAVTESRARIFWKRSDDGRAKALLRFDAPSDLRGAGLLILERADDHDLFIYLPELKKVRRINKRTQSASLFGTDFTYDHFQRLQGFYEHALRERLPDSQQAGRPVYVIEARPPDPPQAVYERVVAFVDRETCVVLRAEFHEPGDHLRHVLHVDPQAITREGTIYVPRRIVMRDVRDETETELVIEEIEVEKPIPDRTFTRTSLELGR